MEQDERDAGFIKGRINIDINIHKIVFTYTYSYIALCHTVHITNMHLISYYTILLRHKILTQSLLFSYNTRILHYTIHIYIDFTTRGMSIQDENILEVILTRSNKELKAALEYHADETGKTLKDIIARYIYTSVVYV